MQSVLCLQEIIQDIETLFKVSELLGTWVARGQEGTGIELRYE
jgi:hypothetical protein